MNYLTIYFCALSLFYCNGCSDFYMNFSNFKFSVRTSDLSTYTNWTLTTWPKGSTFKSEVINWSPKYSVLGLAVSWFGDERYGFPSFFGDSLNEYRLSCSLLALIDSKYEDRSQDNTKVNVLNAVFCHYATQMFTSVEELMLKLDNIAIYGPDALASHYVLRDKTGMSLVIELVDGKKVTYLDANDGVNTFGIMTNEPTVDYHLTNIRHYEWKRTLARQSIAIPGNYYPEERYQRIHMIKSGMQQLMETTTDYQTAFSLATQALNVITVPMGAQYGTDSKRNKQDHTVLGLIRDHANGILYWRDAYNPTFRRIRLQDVLRSSSDQITMKTLMMTKGPYYVDMAEYML